MSTNSARSSTAFDFGEVTAEEDNMSLRSTCTSTGSEDDEFTKLKIERDKQRHDRAMRKLARSASENQPVVIGSSVDLSRENFLLGELAETSRISFNPSDRNDKYRESDNV